MLKTGKKTNMKKETRAQASHDTRPPKALVDFMMTGWKPPSTKTFAPVKGVDRFIARRQALSSQFPGEALIIPTGHEKVRANDTSYQFRPGSDFYYLTGNLELDCVLVLLPNKTKSHQVILFAEPEVDRSTPAFFTDRARGALWVGARLGLKGSQARYRVDQAIGLPDLPSFIDDLVKQKTPVRLLRGISPSLDSALSSPTKEDYQLAAALARMRAIKDNFEIAALNKAISATRRAHEAAIRALKTAKTEREIEAAYGAQANRDGRGVGFSTIVAAGAHSTVLHWTRNDGNLKKGELILIDAGVETDELYTGDITRTLPISGHFSKEQKIIYDLVTDAQDAAFLEVKPGNDFMAPHRAANRILAEGLERLGILPEPAIEAIRDDRQIHKRYTLHNTSHMLGIDVHDSAAIPYRQGKLEPGMVLTIEPGLYFQLNDLTVPARFRGIGIRIEEDVLVTKNGYRVLSAKIPRRSDDVEAWMASLWKEVKD